MRDWSTIAEVFLWMISKKIDSGVDYGRFRLACSHWLSAVPEKPMLPLLLVKYYNAPAIHLYEYPYLERLELQLPEELLLRNHVCGCSKGWVALLDDDPNTVNPVSICNLFSRGHVRLPQFEPNLGGSSYRFNAGSVARLTLSSDPITAPDDCMVMAVFECSKLIFCRPGGDTWTLYKSFSNKIEDIIFYMGSFYVLVYLGGLYRCDIASGLNLVEIIAPPQNIPRDSWGRYLVVSSGDLLLVRVQDIFHSPEQYVWRVSRVDLSTRPPKLVKLSDLGGRSLFLGSLNGSFSAQTFLPNLIYKKRSVLQEGDDYIDIFSMEGMIVSHIQQIADDTPTNWRQIYWLVYAEN